MVDVGFPGQTTPIAKTVPKSETVGGAAGAMNAASAADHQHPRLTSVHRVVLAANGTATVAYTRTFDKKPGIVLTAINPTGRVVALEVVTDTGADGAWTGCTIRGVRSQVLPSLSGILLIGPLLTALGNFDIFGGSAAGVDVSVVAVQQSTAA